MAEQYTEIGFLLRLNNRVEKRLPKYFLEMEKNDEQRNSITNKWHRNEYTIQNRFEWIPFLVLCFALNSFIQHFFGCLGICGFITNSHCHFNQFREWEYGTFLTAQITELIKTDRMFLISNAVAALFQCWCCAIDGSVCVIVLNFFLWLRSNASIRLIAFHSLNLINDETFFRLIFPTRKWCVAVHWIEHKMTGRRVMCDWEFQRLLSLFPIQEIQSDKNKCALLCTRREKESVRQRVWKWNW